MTTPPNSPTVTEFVRFRVKPSVKPEEGEQSREGEQLLDLFRETILQSGHLGSAWGRTVEDENVLVWVIEWADPSNTTSLDRLAPFIDESNNPLNLINYFATMSPSISTTDTLTTNPITELVSLAIPSDLTADEEKQFATYQGNFRNEGITKLTPESARPLSWTQGKVERPASFEHAESASGNVVVYVHVLGWKNMEQHAAARDTQAFKNTIEPIRKMTLSPVKGLEMRHVKFQKIGF